MKQCLICGCEFEPEHNAQKFCKKAHYKKCPVCSKQVIWNSMKPVKPCCPECTNKKRAITNMRKYDCTNAMQIESTKITRRTNKQREKHKLLPVKLKHSSLIKSPNFKLDESSLSLFILSETASKEFLRHNGFRYIHKFGRIHLSLGLVKDGILYQVVRFEKSHKNDSIVLVDFGTRFGYYNPNGYSRLIKYANEFRGIEQFEANIPRNIATQEVIDSLNLTKLNSSDYEVYWIIEDNKLKKLTSWDNIPEMLTKYDYVTTDYIDHYRTK